MACEQASTTEVSETIATMLVRRAAAPIDDVAAAMFVSRSTLQRRLAADGMSFTEVRRQDTVRLAVARLTSGASCACAARAVGLSGDHLCRLVTDRTGLRPRDIARAHELGERARRWKLSPPPRSGTRLYAQRVHRWRALEIELAALLAPIPASGHLLSGWAARLARSSRRPDYRTGQYRRRVRAARSRERAARAAEARRMDAWWAEFQRTTLGTPADDIFSLESLDLYIARALTPPGDAAASNHRLVFV